MTYERGWIVPVCLKVFMIKKSCVRLSQLRIAMSRGMRTVHSNDNPRPPAFGMSLEGQHAVPPHRTHSHDLDPCRRPAKRYGTSDGVVLKVQQIVRQPSMSAT